MVSRYHAAPPAASSVPVFPNRFGRSAGGGIQAEQDRSPRAGAPAESFFRRHLAWALVVLCYVYPFPFFQNLKNPNENVRVWESRAIADHHELSIDAVVAEWGPVDDAAFAGDRLVSGKAPGASFLGVPVCIAQREVHRVLGLRPPSQAEVTRALRVYAVAVPMAAFLLFFARWVERVTHSARARDLLLVGLALGTPMYPYGLLFAGHVHGAALGFVAFALLAEDPSGAGPRLRSALAGACAGFAVVFEYQLAVVLVVLAGWALLRDRRSAVWFLLATLPALVLLGAYHTVLFGRPWALPYGHLANPVYAANDHARGLLGLGVPSTGPLGDLLFSFRRGLFVFSPFLGLGVWGAIRSLGRAPRAPAIVALVLAAAMFAFQAGMSNWSAGWSVGPRYIVVVAPVLAGAAAYCWRFHPEDTLVAGLGGLVLASVFMCGVSGAVFPHYPDVYSNPVFDLAVPLLRSGHAPYNLGRGLGLQGAWSLAPLALIAALALLWAMGTLQPAAGSLRKRLAILAVATALGASHLGLLSARFRDGPGEAEANAFVESVWEPVP